MSYDVDLLRKEFPILERPLPGGRTLVYLDNAATSQKPYAVLDAERTYYETSNAAAHRGVHTLAEMATDGYEQARTKIAGFIGAQDDEIVFTKNSTESINLVAYALSNAATAGPDASRFVVGPGDEVVVTEMEHHSNLVPWQQLCERTGATLRWFGLTNDGRLDLTNIDTLINERTKIVAFVHQSNILGTVNPVEPIVTRAHAVGALVLLDACQSVSATTTWISWPSPATRCSAPPESACSTAAASCSRSCRRS
jgi:cysteine desulfurase/selenocysteine lyase